MGICQKNHKVLVKIGDSTIENGKLFFKEWNIMQ